MTTTLDDNTALVLIDLQNMIVRLPVAHPVNTIIGNCASLLAAFRKAGKPVVIVRVKPAGKWLVTRKDSKSTPGNATPSADGFDIIPEIITQPTDILVTKSTWNAFFETTLDDELKKLNVTGIVIAGISTSIGVEATARSASQLGYQIAFAEDAMTDLFADAHNNSLKYIFPRIGEVGSTASIIKILA